MAFRLLSFVMPISLTPPPPRALYYSEANIKTPLRRPLSFHALHIPRLRCIVYPARLPKTCWTRDLGKLLSSRWRATSINPSGCCFVEFRGLLGKFANFEPFGAWFSGDAPLRCQRAFRARVVLTFGRDSHRRKVRSRIYTPKYRVEY